MKTIKISYKGAPFDIRVKRVNAFPNDVFEIEFSDNPGLTAILDSPVFIIEKSELLSLPEVQNINQRELLMSFAEVIEESLKNEVLGDKT